MIARFCILIESKKIFDDAMKDGCVIVNNMNVLILGMAGAGKTSAKHLIFGWPPPEVRNSTPLAEKPIRAQIREVSGARVQARDSQWKPVETNGLQQIIGETVSKITCNRVSDSGDKLKLVRPTRSYSSTQHATNKLDESDSAFQPPDQIRRLRRSSSPQLLSHIDSIHSDIVDTVEVHKKAEIHAPPKAFSDRFNWIYFIDSGGQPHFHNLMPHFIRGISIALFTFRLCDKLSDHPIVEYYEEGMSIGMPYQSPLSNEDTLKYLVRSMHSQTVNGQKPKLLFIGTFLDKVQDSLESLAEKNEQLLSLLSSDFLDQLVFHDEALNHLIFAVNAQIPGEPEKKVAELIREEISSSSSYHIKVPISWYTLENMLDSLSVQLGRKVLSKLECLEVAHKLNFNKDRFHAALEFFHDNHLLHYFPKILPKIVFTSPQVLLDKLTELVKEAYRIRDTKTTATSGTALKSGFWRQFRDQGIITLRFLEQEQFRCTMLMAFSLPATY